MEISLILENLKFEALLKIIYNEEIDFSKIYFKIFKSKINIFFQLKCFRMFLFLLHLKKNAILKYLNSI
jgi:hypothetical protein